MKSEFPKLYDLLPIMQKYKDIDTEDVNFITILRETVKERNCWKNTNQPLQKDTELL